ALRDYVWSIGINGGTAPVEPRTPPVQAESGLGEAAAAGAASVRAAGGARVPGARPGLGPGRRGRTLERRTSPDEHGRRPLLGEPPPRARGPRRLSRAHARAARPALSRRGRARPAPGDRLSPRSARGRGWPDRS